jgi:hypothetical protein
MALDFRQDRACGPGAAAGCWWDVPDNQLRGGSETMFKLFEPDIKKILSDQDTYESFMSRGEKSKRLKVAEALIEAGSTWLLAESTKGPAIECFRSLLSSPDASVKEKTAAYLAKSLKATEIKGSSGWIPLIFRGIEDDRVAEIILSGLKCGNSHGPGDMELCEASLYCGGFARLAEWHRESAMGADHRYYAGALHWRVSKILCQWILSRKLGMAALVDVLPYAFLDSTELTNVGDTEVQARIVPAIQHGLEAVDPFYLPLARYTEVKAAIKTLGKLKTIYGQPLANAVTYKDRGAPLGRLLVSKLKTDPSK